MRALWRKTRVLADTDTIDDELPYITVMSLRIDCYVRLL